MLELQIRRLAFPPSELARWMGGDRRLLDQLPQSSQVSRILREKANNRGKPGRRFFGEAWSASQANWDEAWYGSFKWLSSWPVQSASPFGSEYRSALLKYFPDASKARPRATALVPHLRGKRPMPPDLWLRSGEAHHFIEVKLPGDSVRDTQVAGLAVIGSTLHTERSLSVWIYDLYPEDRGPSPVCETLQERYQTFCDILETA